MCPNQFEKDYQNTKNLIDRKLTQSYVDEMKLMSAKVLHVAVTILYELLISCYFSRVQITPIVVLQIVQLILWYGATK